MDKDDSDDDDGFIAKEEQPQPLSNEPDDVSKYVKDLFTRNIFSPCPLLPL